MDFRASGESLARGLLNVSPMDARHLLKVHTLWTVEAEIRDCLGVAVSKELTQQIVEACRRASDDERRPFWRGWFGRKVAK